MGGIKFSECALSYLQHANWPGNIRQLKNTVDRICILAEKPLITASCIEKLQECQFDNKPLEKLARSIITLAKGDKIKAMIDALIAEALVESQGNKTKAAEILGVHRKVVERRFQQYVRKDTEYQNLIFKELTC
jgi:DNA-binding NtrC family response regulator